MDLYQAVKTDKCHSSPGRLQVNPDQQGAATCSTQVPACRGAIWTPSATEHDHRWAAEAAFFSGFCRLQPFMMSSLQASDVSTSARILVQPNAYLAEAAHIKKPHFRFHV